MTRLLRATISLALAASVLGPPGDAGAQTDLEALSFLAGCWAGRTGDLDLHEQWTAPDGGAMLGTTRYLRDGAIVDWEFGRIVEDAGRVVFWPYPKGAISEHGFPLVGTDPYVFENLAHDFPVRIIYERVGPDELAPRIEGSDGRGPRWSLRRVACPGLR